MCRKHSPVYPWPASAITREDMALLHQARQQTNPRIPITSLLASAVREVFGVAADNSERRAA